MNIDGENTNKPAMTIRYLHHSLSNSISSNKESRYNSSPLYKNMEVIIKLFL